MANWTALYRQLRFGRLKEGYQANSYVCTPSVPQSLALAAGAMSWVPIQLGWSWTITHLAHEVTAAVAATTIRAAVYSDNGYGLPWKLLAEIPTPFDGNSATVQTTALTTPIKGKPGRIWVAGVSQGGTPTVRAIGAPYPLEVFGSTPYTGNQCTGYTKFGVNGALPVGPLVFNTDLLVGTSAHRIFVKLL